MGTTNNKEISAEAILHLAHHAIGEKTASLELQEDGSYHCAMVSNANWSPHLVNDDMVELIEAMSKKGLHLRLAEFPAGDWIAEFVGWGGWGYGNGATAHVAVATAALQSFGYWRGEWSRRFPGFSRDQGGVL